MPTAQVVSVEPTDNRQSPHNPVARQRIAWKCTDLGVVSQSIGVINGRIIALETDPAAGGDAPTDNYDITLLDSLGHDVLEGLGMNRDTLNTEKVEIYKETTIGANIYGEHPPVYDTLTFTIAVAGDAKSGVAIIYYE